MRYCYFPKVYRLCSLTQLTVSTPEFQVEESIFFDKTTSADFLKIYFSKTIQTALECFATSSSSGLSLHLLQ